MSKKTAETLLPYVTKVSGILGGISLGRGSSGGYGQAATANSQYFAYAALTSVVVIELPGFSVVQTLSINSGEVASVRLSPTAKAHIAILTTSAQFVYYDLSSGDVIFSLSVSNIITGGRFRVMEFAADGTSIMLFSDAFDGTRVNIDLEKKEPSLDLLSLLGVVRYLIPHPTEPVLLAVSEDGVVQKASGFADIHDNLPKVRHRHWLAIDPLNSEICIAFGKNPTWVMFECVPGLTVLAESTRNDVTAHYGDWIPAMPGSVVTASRLNGSLYVWHVANGDVAYTIALETMPVTCLMRVSDKGIVVGFKDGCLGLVDVVNKCYLQKINASHTNAIFGAIIVPNNSGILLTGGLEGSVGVWQLPTLAKKGHFSSIPGGTMTGFCVSPGGGYVACTSSNGTVSVSSMKSATILFTEKLHKDKCTSVAWSPYDSDIIVTSGDDGVICFYNIKERRIVESVQTGSRVRAVTFSPHKNAIAAALYNGSLYVREEGGVVFSLTSEGKSPLFDVAWSPFDEFQVAATDCASGLIIFNLSDQSSTRTHGSGVMESVIWSELSPTLLFTGEASGTITAWNLATMKPLGVLVGHQSDVYGLACHRDHPSLIVSAGKDQRVRVWNTANLAPKEMLNAVFSDDRMIAERFAPYEGAAELAKLVHRITRDGVKISFNDTDPVHVNDIVRLAEKRISKMTSALPHDQATLRRAQHAKQTAIAAADLCLKSGNIKRYCELMFIAGEYDAALAVAPGVSYKFWKNLMSIRAEMLDGSEASAELSLLAGDPETAIVKFDALKKFENSMMISAAMRNTTFLPKTASVARSTSKDQTPNKPPYAKYDFSNPADYTTYRVASASSMKYTLERKPLLAAAALLTIGDVAGAVWKLLVCGELLWALEINKCMERPLSLLSEKLIRAVIASHAYDLAFKNMDPALKRKLVTLVPFKSDEERSVFYKENGLGTIREYVVESKKARGFGRITLLALAGKLTEAAGEGIQLIKEKMSVSVFNFTEIMRYLELFENIYKPEGDPALIWTNVVAVSFYFGVYKAMWRGYFAIIESLGKAFEDIVVEHGIEWLKQRIPEVRIAVALTLAKHQKEDAVKYITGLGQDADTRVFRSIRELPDDYSCDGGSTVRAQGNGCTQVELSSEKYTSFCSGKVIAGNLFFLEDRRTTMDREEALMWFDVTPFSPLRTHQRLTVYTY